MKRGEWEMDHPLEGTSRRALLWTAGGLALAVLAAALMVYGYNANRRQPQSAQRIVSDVEAPPRDQEDYKYLLRADGGRLAVFVKGHSEPEMVFDVPVRVLPDYDQRQLEEGIPVEDYPTLVKLIEDYIS